MSDIRESIGSDNSPVEKAIEVKLVILGKSLVGKSALTYRFINDQFPKEHDTTIEDQYKINMTIDGYNCILVGNKCDLGDKLRKVPTKEAEDFANSKGIPFLETSALTKINVKESFVKLVHDLLEKTQAKNKVSLFGKMCGCNII